jgi:hypothetical protein
MAPLVRLLVEGERLLAVGPVWDDGCRPALVEPFAQFRTIVGLVAKKLRCGLGTTDQTLSLRAVVCVAPAQEDGKKTAFSICDCMDFRIAPAARASNRLPLLPLFAPEAERCALTCVESII